MHTVLYTVFKLRPKSKIIKFVTSDLDYSIMGNRNAVMEPQPD